MTFAGAREAGFVVHIRIELPGCLPERGERSAFPGVIPHARRDHATGGRHALHLAQAGDRVGHEMNDELGEGRIEARVAEGNALGSSMPNVDAWIASFRCGDKLLGGIDRGHGISAEPPHELSRQGARPATDVQHALAGAGTAEIGELRCQLRRVSAHEPVITLGRDLECHGAESRGGECL